jgi:radical SAM superfamily enzyme YgiQ (UPF0313 family)
LNSKKILLVYPEVPETFWSLRHALRFLGKRAWFPPLGLLTVAAMLPAQCQRRLLDLNVGTLQDDDLAWADYVFLSAMDIQRTASRQVIDRCKAAGVKVVAGGPLFTNDPDAFSDVDHLVLNEAELTLPQFLADLASGQPKPRYSSPEFADMRTSPRPAYALIDTSRYAALSVQFSRGCPHQCDFCNVTALFGHRPRTKTAAQVISELDQLYELGWRGRILFVDDNLMCDKKHLKEDLLPAIVEWKRHKRGIAFQTQISLNLADDQELMDRMYQAGFEWVFVGIETPDEGSLKECHKSQNLNRDMPAQIRRLQRSGLQVQGGFIVGFDHDPPDIFRRQFDLIQSTGIAMAMMNVLQAPFGTKLYERLKQEGRICGAISGDSVDGGTNIVTRMDRETLRQEFGALVRRLYRPENYYERVKTFLREYRPPLEHAPVTKDTALAALRCLFWLGLVRSGRRHFWRVFLWTWLHRRDSLPAFFMLAILGYHFRRLHDA